MGVAWGDGDENLISCLLAYCGVWDFRVVRFIQKSVTFCLEVSWPLYGMEMDIANTVCNKIVTELLDM